jgi:protein gp37
MKNSHIEWTDHTFNPWIGCTMVSPGCVNCYAWARDVRFAGGVHWGNGAPRQRTSADNWKQPFKWDREAKAAHEAAVDAIIAVGGGAAMPPRRPRVFCASLADWLDDEVPIEWLADLLKLIHDTPNLDWLLLTKRPQNWKDAMMAVMRYLEDHGGAEDGSQELHLWVLDWATRKAPANVWIGTTVENQEMADLRIPLLIDIPARVRFLSCEPLLGPVNLHVPDPDWRRTYQATIGPANISWVICGGESGPHARPMHPDWARSLRDQCNAACVPFFFKQWGEWYPLATDRLVGFDSNVQFVLPDGSAYDRKTLVPENAQAMIRDGKRRAGRELDGREWNDLPKTEVAA